MFQLLLVKPIFNLLVLIYALLPGHNFGLAIILFTLLVRLLMWPLVKKQLHQTKVMRELQPELKKIKAASKGNKQQESLMMMQLYKERGVSPFSAMGTMIIQLVVVIALYSGLRRIVTNPQAIIDYSYGWIHDLSYLRELGANIGQFARDNNLFGVVDLSKAALPKGGGIYWPAMVLVIGSAISQYLISKQLMPASDDSRTLRQILKDAGEGKKADASETNAAVGRGMRFLIPGMIFLFTVGLPAALSLYWTVGGLIAYIQQAAVLRQDTGEMTKLADAGPKVRIIEGEVVATKPKTAKKKTTSKAVKRRKK
jgi:YidC/Oxa1 family membrane protein insertase